MLVGCRRRGSRLRIDVYDTGIGIPHAKRRAVFKEFHRLDQGARVARGVGLGLSIVERIARVLDCEVALKSTSGRGSRFSVEVPRAAAAVAVPAPQPRAKPSAGQPRRNGRALHRQRARPFSTACRRCWAAGAAACSKPPILPRRWRRSRAAALEPDGLLVDYHLDGDNGLGAIAALRRRYGRDLPAILVTADRSLHVREEARAAGVHVLNKPVKPASLRALIAQWRVQRVAAE